ncbi:hypothetical protein C9374_012351 [Naegleria lovaniensis]|uniref:Uncharacterized protein n=1 Tax=Naegleria lovaniensis TaxID=51637 RepID=A0AA88KCG0_NAELO|nr:uncharacterized protein C9374_012351 [Naegleria lovaniensis]KAG2373248.1 hypothetical protein C9374_012351 [Naegleria lovaniensis]
MYHAGMDQIVDVKIELGPWVWDSVQRWMSLFLEDKECSRCHHPKSEFANIPKNVLNPNEQNDYPNRNVDEAIQIYDNIENLNSNECKGMRPTWEQVLEMKDSQMDDKSRNNKIRELGQRTS